MSFVDIMRENNRMLCCFGSKRTTRIRQEDYLRSWVGLVLIVGHTDRDQVPACNTIQIENTSVPTSRGLRVLNTYTNWSHKVKGSTWTQHAVLNCLSVAARLLRRR